MREILFIVTTWTAAAAYLLSAALNRSPALWFWAAYTSLFAFLALAHAREKRWGSVGSVVLTFGILVLVSRELFLQIADRNHILIPANWMAGFYLMGIGINLFFSVLLMATIYWLASSRPARNGRNV